MYSVFSGLCFSLEDSRKRIISPTFVPPFDLFFINDYRIKILFSLEFCCLEAFFFSGLSSFFKAIFSFSIVFPSKLVIYRPISCVIDRVLRPIEKGWITGWPFLYEMGTSLSPTQLLMEICCLTGLWDLLWNISDYPISMSMPLAIFYFYACGWGVWKFSNS